MRCFQFFLIHTPKIVQMSCFPFAKYIKIWLSLFWLRVCRPLVKNCKAASLACHVSLDAGQTPAPCFMLLLFIAPFVEQSSQLLGVLGFPAPTPVPSVDKYSLIPKIAWNGTIDVSTSVHGKRKV